MFKENYLNGPPALHFPKPDFPKCVPQGTLILHDVTSWYPVQNGFMMKYGNMSV